MCEPQDPVRSHDVKSEDGSWSLSHVTGDLFSCGGDEALAHCISEDCRMGAGIALVFRQRFRGEEELKEQKKLTGQCAVLKRDRRFVYYLITKKKARHKPTYDSLTLSLEDMRSHCVKNGVTRISMPRVCEPAEGERDELGVQGRAACAEVTSCSSEGNRNITKRLSLVHNGNQPRPADPRCSEPPVVARGERRRRRAADVGATR
ncbi:hypothetical protein F2P81_011050 [Scophthalmus maximus]|uniref:Macro domain-containing protein n=1 Tax=Scophthalmus maximus TaxID=52904 RepID=A0A6A4SUF1_SCOMX|nr:hypothetical protein F2P81_011050 [Scophthalmus maximus]